MIWENADVLNRLESANSSAIGKFGEETSDIRKLSTSTIDSTPHEIHQTIPDGLGVKRVPYGHGVFASKFFAKGSVLYVGERIVIPN